MRLKVAVSVICVVLLAGHLFAPSLKLDAVGLALIAIALLPWFQSLLKSLELPGVVKIELQDVKSATEKLAQSVQANVPDSIADAVSDREALSLPTKQALQDPNLALVALRIEIEKRLTEIAKAAGVHVEHPSAASLLRELKARKAIPEDAEAGLAELIALGNQAAHGARVSREAAGWALDLAPQILRALGALRPKAVVTLRGRVEKSEVIGAFQTGQTVRVDFAQPFISTPHIAIGFDDNVSSPLSSGAVHRISQDQKGFEFKVVELPKLYEVSLWSLKWSATGQIA
jgi:hypothetical protein